MPGENEEYNVEQRIAYLEKRMTEGEAFLAKNPNHQKALTGYWRYWDEHTRLLTQQAIRASLNAVTLTMPKPYVWKRDDNSPECVEVKVLFHTEPTEPNETTLEGLKAINEALMLLAIAR